MIIDAQDQAEHVLIDYPCDWPYTVIGEDKKAMEQAILDVADQRECSISVSRTSKGGRYISLKASIYVESDEERTRLFSALSARVAVRYVI